MNGAAAILGIYATLTDDQLEREVVALERKVSALKASSTAVAIALLHDFRKRLDQARAEIDRRRT
jgi:hypothetical protein